MSNLFEILWMVFLGLVAEALVVGVVVLLAYIMVAL